MRLSLLLLSALPALAQIQFRAQEIQNNFGVVYAVSIEDVNHDGKPDIVAINPTQVVWFENPSWKKHVILDGLTKKDNVCFAMHDIDGDGQLDMALGADWQPTNTQSGGSLQWIGMDKGNPTGQWKLTALGNEPTLHRMRWGDIDGDGKKELIVMPLQGRGTKAPDWEGQGARILVFRIPKDPAKDPWPMEVVDDSLHIVHNLIVTNFDDDKQDEILTASKEGVYVHKRAADGKWSKRLIGEGNPGEIKLGHLNGLQRALATVQPWHGNGVVVYEEPRPKLDPAGAPPSKLNARPMPTMLWPRKVLDETLAGAHAIGWGDFDGDGADELAVGWRDKEFGVAIYKRSPNGEWSKRQMVDDGGMAAEDLVVADLNGDGLPEIIAVGRKTANVKIYWNETKPKWVRHVVDDRYFSWTAAAADFDKNGKMDVIGTDQKGKKIYLYMNGSKERRLIHEGLTVIASHVMDVDGDGDMDFIGAQYSPGVVFWLECPKNPAKDEWKFHIIDDVKLGGVDGIHGLILGDVDKDGTLDVIANSAQPKGNFPESLAWLSVPKNPRTAKQWDRHVFADKDAPGLSHYMGVGDLNGDGWPDIAAGAKSPDGGAWFAWWESPGNPRTAKGGWKKHVLATNQPGATNILIGDFNGDNKNDLFATRGHGFGALYFQSPEFTLKEVNESVGGPHSLALGDIDGDGHLDAVTVGKDSMEALWFQNDGKGNFTAHVIYLDQASYDIKLIDMDGDGDLDLLVAGQNSDNVVWYENRLKR